MCAASLAMTLVACQGSPNPGSGGPSPGADRSPSGYGVVFLGVDECSSRGRNTFTEVPCRSERAVARVTARYDGKAADGPMCPARTDFVLHLSEDRPPPVGSDGTAAGEIPQGYACMRNLEPPHPGDPGAAAGPARSSGTACTRRAAARSARPPATAPARRNPGTGWPPRRSTAPSALRSRRCT